MAAVAARRPEGSGNICAVGWSRCCEERPWGQRTRGVLPRSTGSTAVCAALLCRSTSLKEQVVGDALEMLSRLALDMEAMSPSLLVALEVLMLVLVALLPLVQLSAEVALKVWEASLEGRGVEANGVVDRCREWRLVPSRRRDWWCVLSAPPPASLFPLELPLLREAHEGFRASCHREDRTSTSLLPEWHKDTSQSV